MKQFMKHLLRRAVAVLTAASLAAGAVPAYASEASAGTSEQAGKVSGVWTLDMWHYSGGYWKVGNAGNDKIRIDDKDVTSLDSYLQASQQAVFSVSVPQEIAQLVACLSVQANERIVHNQHARACSQRFHQLELTQLTTAQCNNIFVHQAVQMEHICQFISQRVPLFLCSFLLFVA